ncbi:ssDNA-binding protein [Alteromonas phage vB_AcoS-R7M]|uniref:SsDNA-binding protein n=1 Tax=Alteromonas phage vB_AcoS-R7M TaxID=2729541 RepID=A0A6M3YP80_9CAUD|nr:ssDNA-binding protein [Alteromonas phage vB_AcoS-R7M]QJI53378.1 ssDNA-binding protein [Alteromonas phage vB_AcoS-R7M]
MAQLNFDATQVQPNAGASDPVPAGWYSAMVDESEIKPTKGGDGAYLQLRLNIIDGQYANRKLWVRLNIQNPSQQAVDIAMSDLSAICHAVGVMHLQDSNQLHGIPMKVKVKLRPATENYEASNDVTSYKNINENVGGTEQAGGTPAGFGSAGATGQNNGGQPAWANQQTTQQPAQQPTQQQAPVQQPAPQTQQQPQQQWQQPQSEQPWAQGQQVAQQQPPQTEQQPPQQQQWQQPTQQEAAPGANTQTQQPPQQQQAPAQDGIPPWQRGQ